MKASISSTYIYTIVIIFMFIIFAFITGTIIYYKSFKVNKSILSIIEKYEGYNKLSAPEIETQIQSIGYNVMSSEGDKCPKKSGGTLVTLKDEDRKYRYCIYKYEDKGISYKDKNGKVISSQYSYGVVTYVSIDFPFFDVFLRIPVHSKSNSIHKFG